MKKYLIVLILLQQCIFTTNLSAQNEFNILHSEEGMIYITFDFDPAPAVSIGYAKSYSFDKLNRNISFSIEISKPIFLWDFENFQIELSARIPVTNPGEFRLINRLNFIIHSIATNYFSGTNLAVEDALLFGYFSNNFYFSGEAGYTKFIVNYIAITESNNDTGNWYSGAGGKITLGVLSGYRFDKHFDISLRTALVKTESFKNFNPAGPPLLTNFGIGYIH